MTNIAGFEPRLLFLDEAPRVLILDDARSAEQAIKDASLVLNKPQITIIRPMVWSDGIDFTLTDAHITISTNPRFDIWVLDNDLGDGIEGLGFLKWCIATIPHKVPEQVYSCSANPVRRRDIEQCHQEWMKSRPG